MSSSYSDESMIHDLEKSLTNHPPTPEKIEAIELIRQVGIAFGRTIIENAPSSAQRTIAVRKLEESVMWAVKGVVLEDIE